MRSSSGRSVGSSGSSGIPPSGFDRVNSDGGVSLNLNPALRIQLIAFWTGSLYPVEYCTNSADTCQSSPSQTFHLVRQAGRADLVPSDVAHRRLQRLHRVHVARGVLQDVIDDRLVELHDEGLRLLVGLEVVDELDLVDLQPEIPRQPEVELTLSAGRTQRTAEIAPHVLQRHPALLEVVHLVRGDEIRVLVLHAAVGHGLDFEEPAVLRKVAVRAAGDHQLWAFELELLVFETVAPARRAVLRSELIPLFPARITLPVAFELLHLREPALPLAVGVVALLEDVLHAEARRARIVHDVRDDALVIGPDAPVALDGLGRVDAVDTAAFLALFLERRLQHDVTLNVGEQRIGRLRGLQIRGEALLRSRHGTTSPIAHVSIGTAPLGRQVSADAVPPGPCRPRFQRPRNSRAPRRGTPSGEGRPSRRTCRCRCPLPRGARRPRGRNLASESEGAGTSRSRQGDSPTNPASSTGREASAIVPQRDEDVRTHNGVALPCDVHHERVFEGLHSRLLLDLVQDCSREPVGLLLGDLALDKEIGSRYVSLVHPLRSAPRLDLSAEALRYGLLLLAGRLDALIHGATPQRGSRP